MALVRLGLISLIEHPSLHQQGPDITWRQFMCDLLHLNRDTYYENVKSVILEKLDHNTHQMNAIEELGLLSEELVVKSGNPLDSLAIFMAKRLAYSYCGFRIEIVEIKLLNDVFLEPGERDIIIMHHEIGYKWPTTGQTEKRTVEFIQYGDANGNTAMAKTVGLPTAITAKMVLESKCTSLSRRKTRLLTVNNYFKEEIQTTGMVLPLSKDIYKPILNRLQAEGLSWRERVRQN